MKVSVTATDIREVAYVPADQPSVGLCDAHSCRLLR